MGDGSIRGGLSRLAVRLIAPWLTWPFGDNRLVTG